MTFLLDTNTVSEWVKPRPNSGVVAWMDSVDEDRTFISVVSLAELHYGVERLADGKRRARLEKWLCDELPARFENRILAVDVAIAECWGKTVSQSQSIGRPMGPIDGFLAATAQVHGLILVTRNTSDFPMVKVLNPWSF